MAEKLVIVGAGVAGVNAATKLVDSGYPGENITIIDMGKDPYRREYSEVMEGFLGAGGWSDGKLTYHTSIGGQLSKYCGEEKAMELFDEVIANFKRFHPKPEEVQCSDPQAEPDFIKPYFGLRLFPVWHVGTDYLHEIGKNWYDFLVDNGVKFEWERKVTGIDFKNQTVDHKKVNTRSIAKCVPFKYDRLIFAVGKSGIDFGKQLADDYKLPTEPKPVQIGVRFEAPQEHFQKLIDISYDFKLYRKFDEGVSLRSFCTNNNAAYVAVEETYGNHSYNGHAKKDEAFRNNMTNFGILMEIPGIEEPFAWSRELVSKVNKEGTGLYYSPTRTPSTTSEGDIVSAVTIDEMDEIRDAFQGYYKYIDDFIDDMKKVFPTLGDDWGVYVPEVKYLSPEPLVNYENLSLNDFPNVHFVGDALSARGITVSGAQGIYVTDYILEQNQDYPDFHEHF
ncbi:FAD-dependent oxidoreductase [bacterium]|nr:FAD-dependent oxidoreductase [bacterium]